MRIKLTHLIIVSLITLTVAFSAISNANAAFRVGGVLESNTTGGGFVVYKQIAPADEDDEDSICDMIYDQAIIDCYKGQNQQHYGDNLMPPRFDVIACYAKAHHEYKKCQCMEEDNLEACKDMARGIIIQQEPTINGGGTGTVNELPATTPHRTRPRNKISNFSTRGTFGR